MAKTHTSQKSRNARKGEEKAASKSELLQASGGESALRKGAKTKEGASSSAKLQGDGGPTRVFVMGDENRITALASKEDCLDCGFTYDDPNYYQANASWSGLPIEFPMATRVKTLQRMLVELGKDGRKTKIGNLRDNKEQEELKACPYDVIVQGDVAKDGADEGDIAKGGVPRPLGEYLRWLLVECEGGYRAHCRETVSRSVESSLKWYLESKKGAALIPSEAGEAWKSLADDSGNITTASGRKPILAVYNVAETRGGYGIYKDEESDSNELSGFYQELGHIVVRSSIERLCKDKRSFVGDLIRDLWLDANEAHDGREQGDWEAAQEQAGQDRADQQQADDQRQAYQKHDQQRAALLARSVFILSVESLRRGGYNIRKGLSWEKLIEETLQEMRQIDALKFFGCVLVMFHHEGCLAWYPPQGMCDLFYCPAEMEDTLVREVKNAPYAAAAVLQAAIVHFLAVFGESLSNSSQRDDKSHGQSVIRKAVQHGAMRGLCAMRHLLRAGLRVNEEAEGDRAIDLPYDDLATLIADPKSMANSGYDDMRFVLTMTDHAIKDFKLMDCLVPSTEKLNTAKRYVREGAGAMQKSVPFLKMGALLTYEREEIEQLSNVRNMLDLYIHNDKATVPLSICVFGSPGSGKSFAVKQIAKALGVESDGRLEFNLSQMEGYAELATAFRHISEAAREGETSLVFFDEFDCPLKGNILGWLKYFLAPMQDGVYRDGGENYCIGKVVFVFAGGTSKTYGEFDQVAKDPEASTAKAKDFLSRVKGYVNVMSVNPSGGERDEIPYIKRAVLLRSLMLSKMGVKDEDAVLDVDEKVLNAFLQAETFLHDARSIDAIVATSDLAAGYSFTPSCIKNNCLDMHATSDFREFLSQSSDINKAWLNSRPSK